MGYLLDTHTLLWYLIDDANLSKTAHKIWVYFSHNQYFLNSFFTPEIIHHILLF